MIMEKKKSKEDKFSSKGNKKGQKVTDKVTVH